MVVIGVPKEIKNHEYRVGLTPEAVKIIVENKHNVLFETGAGTGSGFYDSDFQKAGARIADEKTVWLFSNIIVKVKEPLPSEYGYMVPGQIIFSFFHFPANQSLKEIILEKKIRALPYENIQLEDGSRPILRAMSKIAAEVSVDAAAHYSRKENGGKGILLRDATAVVIGCNGNLGRTAFSILAKRGVNITGFDRMERVKMMGLGVICRKYSHLWEFQRELKETLSFADIVICAAAARGEGAPKLITREIVKSMQPGSVIVDPSIDEGGGGETSRPTTHDNPVYTEEGIIHYCVANMPGAVPRSSTPALVEETLPYILEVVNKGWEKALKKNSVLAEAAKID